MKIVTQLDSNGYFVGTVKADPSPLEKDVWLIPGGCIEVEAPSIPKGKRAKWDGEWVFEDMPETEKPDDTKLPSDPTPEEIEAAETEALIQQEMRQMAIDSLKVKGKLTTDGKMVKVQ